MRQLRRPQFTPPTLREGGAAHRISSRHRLQRESDPESPLTFPRHWKESDVRGILYAMHGRVCAYCQCSIKRDRGDVEHFRPFSIYWWLAYDFTNYLLSCKTCNQDRKSGLFPLARGARRATFPQREEVADEARLLLDPAVDAVEDWLRTDFEDDLCRVRNRADAETEPLAWSRVESTIRLFRLNLDLALIRERLDVVEKALELLDEQIDDATSQLRLRRMASRFAPHGVSVRAVLEAFEAQLLPTAEEELRWLFEDFIEDLDRLRKFFKVREDPILERNREEILWALAALWADPPASTTPEEIADWLVDAGIHDEVRALHEQLS